MFRFSHVVQSLTYGQPEYYIVQGIIFNVLMAFILNEDLLLTLHLTLKHCIQSFKPQWVICKHGIFQCAKLHLISIHKTSKHEHL